MTLENPRIRFAHFSIRSAEMHCSRGVGGPIEVLPARIAEISCQNNLLAKAGALT